MGEKKLLFTGQLKQKIITRLKEKGISPEECPMCRKADWVMGDGFFNLSVQKAFPTIGTGGRVAPCIALICKNCGYMSPALAPKILRDILSGPGPDCRQSIAGGTWTPVEDPSDVPGSRPS